MGQLLISSRVYAPILKLVACTFSCDVGLPIYVYASSWAVVEFVISFVHAANIGCCQIHGEICCMPRFVVIICSCGWSQVGPLIHEGITVSVVLVNDAWCIAYAVASGLVLTRTLFIVYASVATPVVSTRRVAVVP